MRVRRADLEERLALGWATESADRICTKDREPISPCKFVPVLLETNGSVLFAGCPQESHHFPEHANARITRCCHFGNGLSYDFIEASQVRPAANHEPG